MTAIQYTYIDTGDQQFLTVFIPGRDPLVASDQHPNFEAIKNALDTNDYHEDAGGVEWFVGLFSVERAVAQRFTRLSDRVSVAGGRVYFDGDQVDDSITRQIVRFLDEGVGDWQPLVRFMENVAANPQAHSREQLYDWLRAREFTITPDGCIVGYKGVTSDGNGGFVSGFSGHAIVDGERKQGRIPNAVGSVVEMPRTSVAHDPRAACSTGLHVGTFDYASAYANGAMLRVHVNPRDVVSVPTDAAGEKVRVCRYTVEEIIDRPVSEALYGYDEDDYDEYGYDEYAGY